MNARLAQYASAHQDPTTTKHIWDAKGPFDVCTWSGTKTVENVVSGYHSAQISNLTAATVTCDVSRSKMNGTVTFAITFTQPLDFNHHFEARACAPALVFVRAFTAWPDVRRR